MTNNKTKSITNFAVVGAGGSMGQIIINEIKTNNPKSKVISFYRNDDIENCISKFDVMIDFTLPLGTMKHLEVCTKFKKPIVIGTTGFNKKQLKIIKDSANKIPIFFSSNMSFGVHICMQLLQQATKMIGKDSDIEIIETHHNNKIDAPSGTAIKMGELIANSLGKKLEKVANYQRVGNNKKRTKGSIGFSSIRGGDIVGEHSVSFFMAGEKITISHHCYQKTCFARGAIIAACWLKNKKNSLYGMSDLLSLIS